MLAALARALQLDDAERAHLFDLARAASATARTRRRTATHRIRPGVQRILDSMTSAPAWVRNTRIDFLAANRLGLALYQPMIISPVRPANNARFTFLDPRSRDFYTDWERAANDLVAMLRTEAGRNPFDQGLIELIGKCPPVARTSAPPAASSTRRVATCPQQAAPHNGSPSSPVPLSKFGSAPAATNARTLSTTFWTLARYNGVLPPAPGKFGSAPASKSQQLA